MKPMKVAAIVAGSLVAAGAASPAFAVDYPPTTLGGGINTLTTQSKSATQPLTGEALDSEKQGSLLNEVKGATTELNQAKHAAPAKLIGGLPVSGS
ncbi:hypothetical protein ABZ532_18200 [Streptomyces sp. NPDC019396]|uniref:hypothetical protein n=1 Tax=Streptomyces sp. NPDC019396 TaxID=3154687 RepID=UPI003402ABD6